ncbi:MAG: hypothetical protein GX232_03840, partial [Acholeplasmataceae bacterium]|nr:hypothetical protein [Acholeplasmataceae bacterium]
MFMLKLGEEVKNLIRNEIPKEAVLFNHATGVASGTLSDSVANYDYIEVFYNVSGDKDGQYGSGSTKIYQANNTKASLLLATLSDGMFYINSGLIQLSNNSFALDVDRAVRIRLSVTPQITTTMV